MEKKLRKSCRTRKPLRNPEFVYDTEFVRDQARGVSSSSGDSATESVYPTSDNSGKNRITTRWSDHVNFPDSEEFYDNIQQRSRDLLAEASRHQESDSFRTPSSREREVNIAGDRERKISSTRADFLNISKCFLSVSSTFNSNSSDMSSGSEKGCMECEECTQGQVCVNREKIVPSKSGTTTADEVMAKMMLTLQMQDKVLKNFDKISEKFAKVSEEVNIIRTVVEDQNVKIDVQDRVINNFLNGCNADDSSDVRNNSVKIKTFVNNIKKDRVEEEKKRSLKVCQDKLPAKGDFYSTEDGDPSSEEEPDLRAIRKKMTRQQREKCNRTVAARMEEVGGTFPEDSFDTSDNSGTDSCNVREKCKHSRQVKSGAKIKKRPVKYTELWPHTIAIEDDGDDVDSDNIGLAKFFSCFTYIMLGCGTRESRGRSGLLHAVSTVLEYLQWPEARSFHNIVMLKIEQGVADWSTDFGPLAEKFIDKKVRLGMRSRNSAGGRYSSGKSSYGGKSFGKGFGGYSGSNYQGGTGKGKPLFGAVCHQWNYGTCTYGSSCKRWHVCKACAETGKLGEQHKALSHDSSRSRNRPTQDT